MTANSFNNSAHDTKSFQYLGALTPESDPKKRCAEKRSKSLNEKYGSFLLYKQRVQQQACANQKLVVEQKVGFQNAHVPRPEGAGAGPIPETRPKFAR